MPVVLRQPHRRPVECGRLRITRRTNDGNVWFGGRRPAMRPRLRLGAGMTAPRSVVLGILMVRPPRAPLAAGAQPAEKRFRVGVLCPLTCATPPFEALRQGLLARGYLEGRTITFEYRAADGKYEKYSRSRRGAGRSPGRCHLRERGAARGARRQARHHEHPHCVCGARRGSSALRLGPEPGQAGRKPDGTRRPLCGSGRKATGTRHGNQSRERRGWLRSGMSASRTLWSPASRP